VIAKFDQSSRLGMGPDGQNVAAHIALTHDIPTFSFDDDEGVVGRVIQAADKDGELCLDVVDAILRLQPEGIMSRADQTVRLADTLTLGGSFWMVAPDSMSLVRRVDPTAVAQFAAATADTDVASEELREAWGKAYGRNPDPSDAWEHAIKACEALLIPMVVPNQNKANLGHVLGQLRKETFQLIVQDNTDTPQNAVNPVLALEQMLHLIYPNPDRHPAPSRRNPSQHEAEAVVNLAVLVVQWARSGVLAKK
jgi:hypothetical protein